MDDEEKKNLINSYVDAYNSFDIDGMTVHVHPDIIFKNFMNGEETAKAEGAEQFRQLADKSKALFVYRHQNITKLDITGDTAKVNVVHEGILAADHPSGVKAGEPLTLNGQSEFEFKDGKLFKITDSS